MFLRLYAVVVAELPPDSRWGQMQESGAEVVCRQVERSCLLGKNGRRENGAGREPPGLGECVFWERVAWDEEDTTEEMHLCVCLREYEAG